MQTSQRTGGIVAHVALAVVLLAACGGSKASSPDPDPATQPAPAGESGPADPDKAAALERLRERQAVVCNDLCEQMVECARADALENNPDALATKDGVTGEMILKKAMDDCVADCNGGGLMTPEQRKTLVEVCFPMDNCAEFGKCAQDAMTSGG